MKLFTRKKEDDSPHGERIVSKIDRMDDSSRIDDSTRIESRIEDFTRIDSTSRILDDNRDIEDRDIEADYIDPDDLNYSDYDDIVETIENNGWSTKSSSGIYSISHLDTNIVVINPVTKDSEGKVLEVICDKDMIIAICGFHQSDIDEDDFYNTPNLYTTPHFVTLKCADRNNVEISPNTLVSILKVKDGISEKLYEEFYADLSPTINGEFKQKQDRYYIAETIILQRGERLIFYVHHPDKDISKVEFLMMSDFFLKDKE